MDCKELTLDDARQVAEQWILENPDGNGHDLITGTVVENEYDYIFRVQERSSEILIGTPLPVAVSKQSRQARPVDHVYFENPNCFQIRMRRLVKKLMFWKKA